jgi:hypothetical protein
MKAVPNIEDPLKGSNSKALVAYDTLKDTMGRFRTKSLFVEHKHDKYPAPYTLKPYNHKGAMSMYKKYMEIGDPTEYTQAEVLLGGWEHWETLCASEWFTEIVGKWRAELKVKMESDRWLEADETARNQSGTPAGMSATKWLSDKYGAKVAPKRGRPSKAEKVLALNEYIEDNELTEEDAERLGL